MGDREQDLVIGRDLPSEAAVCVFEGAAQDADEVFDAERLEDEDAQAREQRADDLEGGILSRRADEQDVSALDEREEGVLLRFVEAVDLVDEEERALARLGADLLRLLHQGAHLLDAGEDGGEGREAHPALCGDETCEGRLAAARRPPQDEALVLAGGDHALEDLALAEQLSLSDVLSDRARSHAVREGRVQRRVGDRRGDALFLSEEVRHLRHLGSCLRRRARARPRRRR